MRHRHDIVKQTETTTTIAIRDDVNPAIRHELDLDTAAYLRWVAGAHVQDAFPAMERATREILITGIGPQSWEREFGHPDPDDAQLDEIALATGEDGEADALDDDMPF